MKLTSSAFQHLGALPRIYSCQGKSINPPLDIADVPAQAKSLALIVTDPDSPSGDYIHWLLWNIDPSTAQIKENSVPAEAFEGLTSTAKPGYVGPCPHEGEHSYIFELIALDSSLNVTPAADVNLLRQAIFGHILETAILQGRYEITKNLTDFSSEG